MRATNILYIIILTAILFSSCENTEDEEVIFQESPELFIAGYLPWYGFDNFDFEALQYIDRIYYFSLAPDENGNFQMSDTHKNNIERLKNEIDDADIEFFIVIGGWYESETIFPMAKDADKRNAYVNSLVEFCIENNIDGVDLDWEAYPTTVPEADYFALIDLLSTKLHENNLKLTVAVAASHYNLSAQFKNKVEQINIMSYGVLDDNGNQVPIEMLKEWLNKFDVAGVPRSKLIVGVPFYGKRSYDSADSSPQAITYSSIVKQSSPAFDVNNFGKYSFNGRSLMQTKTKFLRKNGYYGIMVWELSQDVEINSQFSLLKSISQTAK